VGSRVLILDKTRRNRSSSITAETRIQLLRCDPRSGSRERLEGRSSSDPLVGGLGGGHGSEDRNGPDTKRRLEGRPQSRQDRQRVEPGAVISGFDPSSSILLGCCLAQSGFLRCPICFSIGRGGGDEETRTPDPLLAKEMLCQLSYVPPPREVVGVSGLEPETSALSGQCSNQLS
jgi:hypothetical protein